MSEPVCLCKLALLDGSPRNPETATLFSVDVPVQNTKFMAIEATHGGAKHEFQFPFRVAEQMPTSGSGHDVVRATVVGVDVDGSVQCCGMDTKREPVHSPPGRRATMLIVPRTQRLSVTGRFTVLTGAGDLRNGAFVHLYDSVVRLGRAQPYLLYLVAGDKLLSAMFRVCLPNAMWAELREQRRNKKLEAEVKATYVLEPAESHWWDETAVQWCMLRHVCAKQASSPCNCVRAIRARGGYIDLERVAITEPGKEQRYVFRLPPPRRDEPNLMISVLDDTPVVVAALLHPYRFHAPDPVESEGSRKVRPRLEDDSGDLMLLPPLPDYCGTTASHEL